MPLFKKREQQAVEWLIVGLGNPGAEYAQTRHNLGFMAVDLMGASYWKTQHKALTARSGDLLLAKPQTFMNNSGRALGALVKATGIDPAQRLIVIHDELDLPAGVLRIKRGGGHGGHNGLRSIIETLGTQDFIRVRAGIGRPPGRMDGADYVLQATGPAQLEELRAEAQVAADATRAVVAEGLLAAQNFYHRACEEYDGDKDAKRR